MLARKIESGFYLLDRCQTDLLEFAECFPPEGPEQTALKELIAAVRKVEDALRYRPRSSDAPSG